MITIEGSFYQMLCYVRSSGILLPLPLLRVGKLWTAPTFIFNFFLYQWFELHHITVTYLQHRPGPEDGPFQPAGVHVLAE